MHIDTDNDLKSIGFSNDGIVIRWRPGILNLKARKVKNQTLSIYTEVKNALDKIKKRNEVWYLEIPTTRIKDHVGIENDSYLKYRNPKIIDEAIKKDDLKNLRKKVKNPNLVDIRIEQEINQAIDFAENDKFPNKKDLFKNVLA